MRYATGLFHCLLFFSLSAQAWNRFALLALPARVICEKGQIVRVDPAGRLHVISSIDGHLECLVSHLLIKDPAGMAPRFDVDSQGHVFFQSGVETLKIGKVRFENGSCAIENGHVVDLFIDLYPGNSVDYSGHSPDTRCYRREGKWRRESVETMTFKKDRTGKAYSFSGFSDDVFWSEWDCDSNRDQPTRIEHVNKSGI